MTESEVGRIINMLVEEKKSFNLEWHKDFTFFECGDLVISGSDLETVLTEVKERYVSH